MRRTRQFLASQGPRNTPAFHRHRARLLEAFIVGVAILAVSLVVVSGAGAHRLISGDYAQRSANNKIQYTICGGSGWVCGSVWAPIYECGSHSWCWSGVSHKEAFWFWQHLRSSRGTVNGHTGSVTIYDEW